MMERTKVVGDERTAPSPEVLEKPVRRQFAVEYKAKILAEADACTAAAQSGSGMRPRFFRVRRQPSKRRRTEAKSAGTSRPMPREPIGCPPRSSTRTPDSQSYRPHPHHVTHTCRKDTRDPAI